MRSYLQKSEFFKKMKKKPALQNIIDNIDHYGLEDLENVDQPLWIREELKNYKNRNKSYITDKVENIAQQMAPIENQGLEKPITYLSVYECKNEIWVSTLRNNEKSIDLEINCYDTVCISNKKTLEIKTGAVYRNLTYNSWVMLFNNCVYIKDMTIKEYTEYEHYRRLKKHGLTSDETNNDDRGLFLIQRH